MPGNPIENVTIVKAAGTAGQVSIFPPGSSDDVWVLRSMKFMPNASLSADNTNYASLRAYKGTGTGTPVCAARPTTVAGGALTAGTKVDLALTATGADLEISQANPLTLQVTHGGTGGAVDGNFAAEFEWLKRGAV